MHHFLCTTAIALLGACSLPALAAADGPAAQRIEISAPRSAVLAAEAVLALRGEDKHFEMSNGRNLVITSYGDHVQIRYARRSTKTLRHDGRGNFVSHDGQLALQFEVDAGGEARLVRLSAPATWL